MLSTFSTAVFRSAVVVILAGAALAGTQEAGNGITADAIRAHLFFLSGDRLEGRAPGTRGGEIAADYIAGRFMASGLEGVNGSYFQDVPMTGVTVDPATVALAFETRGSRLPAAYPSDAVIWTGSSRRGVQLSGELVFVGYGIRADPWRWDDYKGQDVRGDILLFLVGDPPAPPEEPDLFAGRALTYYGRWSYKLEEARRRGAAGALIVHRADAAGYGWDVVAHSWTGEQLRLADSDEPSPLRMEGWLTSRFTRQALRQAGLELTELTALAARRDFRPIATGITVRARMSSRSRAVSARNVVGYRPGLDDEVVVLTAHYDHLGIGPAVDGDSIYNGAYDNAGGVGILLEVADAFGRADPARRGLLFLATTGEEAGLLGAREYVANPLFPLARTAATINVDGANLWGVTRDVIAPGASYSTLEQVLTTRADEMGLDVRSDPAPQNGAFFRSDHFAFARAGVPSLYLQHGLDFRDRPAGWGDSVMTNWQREHYHQPSDEFDPRADLSGAVQQARLIFSVAWEIANAEAAPRWRQDAPFGPTPGRVLP